MASVIVNASRAASPKSSVSRTCTLSSEIPVPAATPATRMTATKHQQVLRSPSETGEPAARVGAIAQDAVVSAPIRFALESRAETLTERAPYCFECGLKLQEVTGGSGGSCIDGHFTEPKEQKTQQSPGFGRSCFLQFVHS